MRRTATMKFALLVLYAAGTLAVPVPDRAAPKATVSDIECKSTRFRGTLGTTFEYQYNGETINNVEGSSTKSTGLQLSARTLITQLDDCKIHMSLLDVELRSKSMNEDSYSKNAESAAMKSSLEKYSLLFTMDGNNAITAVFPHNEESTESLNIKRGIISTLQLDNSATSGKENDIHGVCETTITTTDGVTTKRKNLSSCSDRAQNEIGIQSSSIKTESGLKPLDSDSACTYTMRDEDSETIGTVVCTEKHVFRPFSAGYESTSGAMTFVNQKIKFTSYKIGENVDYESQSYPTERSVIFEHTTQDTTRQASTLNEQVEEVMKRLISLSAKQTSAADFTKLVTLFRKMTVSKMTYVWEMYFDCVKSTKCNDNNLKDLYRQYMLDAIAYCGTPSCVSVVKDFTISGDVVGERANMFLQSIALVAKTTTSMIRDILDIAENKPSRQAFLTLGTLISRHCAKTPADCDIQAGTSIIQAENYLEKTLGICSGQENHARVEEILMVIKAIGNAKRPVNVRSALIRCAKTSQHTNITMSAFDALRGMPCDNSTIEGLRLIVEDENVDADTRIYAFQASMRCPTRSNLELLVRQHNFVEQNNQLTSFMSSYFTNLLESSDPDNKVAKDLLTSITKESPLKESDALPFYQYSKHMEKSLYLESIKTGASIKSNLVFHPDGFLPKSAMFDVTAQVMGVPINIVETAVGIDGAETLLENVFGPEGALPENFALNLFDWKLTSEKLKEMAQKASAKNRDRRAVKPADMVNDIHAAINMQPVQPSGFLSLKVMGQEVRMMSYDDIFALIEQVDNMNVIQLLSAVAKGGEKTFSKSVMFLEMTHTVPTGLGLPLKLKLSGTTVSTVELNGKFDIRNMFWGKGALAINGFIKPSAVVEISGSMAVESKFVSTGLLISSNMMVSNVLKGSINYKEGQLFKVNLDTPSEPVQLFKFSSTPYMFMDAQTDIIEGVPRTIRADKCFKSQLIGYGLCTSMRLPVAFREYESPYFPLSGPAHAGITLVRGDDKLSTFQFQMKMKKGANGVDGVIEMSTPGAVYERKVSGSMRYQDVDNVLSMVLSSEKFGRKGSIAVSYNKLTRRSAVEVRNNFFTTKDVVSRIVYSNDSTSLVKQQYGIELSLEYDWYRFQHETKYVRQATSHALVTKTKYYPNKDSTVKASLEYNTQERKLTASMAAYQIKQEVELAAQMDNDADEKGISVTATHKPTGKTAKFYVGYKSGGDKIEIMTSARMFGKTMKNILGWYKNGDIQSIEDFFLFNGNTAKFVAALENKDGEKALEFSADVLGRKALSTVLYTNQGAKQIIEVTVEALKQKASSSIVITNDANEKSIKIAAEGMGKTAQAKVGYYATKDITLLKYEANVLGKQLEVFWDLKTTGNYQSIIGAVFGQYVAGSRIEYLTKPKAQVCEYVYYGTKANTKDLVITCMALNNVNNEDEVASKELMLSMEIPALSRKVGIKGLLTTNDGQVTIELGVQDNGRALFTNKLDISYKDPLNSYISLEAVVGALRGEVKAFIQKQTEAIDFGLQLNGFDQSILLLNRYRQFDLTDAKDTKITTSVVLNGRTLPVTTSVSWYKGSGVAGPRLHINVAKYTLSASSKFYFGERYGVQYETVVMKENSVLFKGYNEIIASFSASKRRLENRIGFSVLGKDYTYGWEVACETRRDDKQASYMLIGRVQYATDRYSSIYMDISDTEKSTTVVADVEYISGKRVRHSLRLTKGSAGRLDVSVEFLPKMFAKLMMRLDDRSQGYKLVTRASLDWKNFKPVITWTNGYINNANEFSLTSGLASDTFVSVKLDKPSTLTLTASLFGNEAKLMIEYKDKNVTTSFALNDKEIKTLSLSYDQLAQQLRLVAKRGEEALFKMEPSYKKGLDTYKIAVASVKKAVKFDIQDGIDKIITISNRYARFQLNKEESSVSIYAIPLQAQLKLRVVPERKEIIITMKGREGKYTLALRADWNKRVLAAHTILNKARTGVKIGFEERSIIVRIVAPKLVLKTVATFKNNALRLAVKRDNVNEAVFEYTLSKDTCDFILQWNTETIRSVVGSVKPTVQDAVNQVLAAVSQLRKQYGALDLISLSKEAKAEVLRLLSTMEKDFDEYDFVAARKQIGESAIKAWKKLSAVLVKSYNALEISFNKLKVEVPATIEKLNKVVTDVKKLADDIDFKKITENAQKLVPKMQELVTKGKVLLATMKTQLNGDLAQITEIITKAVTNLAETSRPIVEKAIVLLKDFKIRGKRMEDIVKMARSEGEKYMKIYIEKVNVKVVALKANALVKFNELKGNATVKLAELKVKITEACDKATEYLLKLKVPYTDKTVAQVVKLIKETIAGLKQTIKALDIKKLTNAMKVKVMAYKVSGKSIAEYVTIVKQQIEQLKKQVKVLSAVSEKIVKELPETTRKALKDLVAKSRQLIVISDRYIITAKYYANQVGEFARPLVKYVRIVAKSVRKHFGPVYKKAVRQLRDIKVKGFRLGPMVDIQIGVINEMVANAQTTMDKQMTKLNTVVSKLKSQTPEQLIDASIDKSVLLCKEIVAYVNKVIKDKDLIKQKAVENVKRVYNKLVATYKDLTNKSIDQMTEEILKLSNEKAAVTAEEIKKFINQIVAMDVSERMWKTWANADIIGRIERYQINEKIDRAIKLAKDSNMTDIIAKTIDTVEEFILATAQQSYTKAMENYAKVEKVIAYLKSISKEDYEAWIKQVQTFTLNNRENLIKTLTRVSESSRRRAIKAYEEMEKLVQNNKAAASQWYELIAERSQLVYSDVKQPTIDVYQHYNSIISNFSKAQYEIIRRKLTSEFERLYNDLEGRLAELKIKCSQKINDVKLRIVELRKMIEARISELKEKVVVVYDNFMAKYGDLTWNEVQKKLEEFGLESYSKARVEVIAKYTKILEIVNKVKANITATVLKMKADAFKLYEKAIAEYSTIVAKVQAKYIELKKYVDAKIEEIKAIIVERYNKLETNARKEAQKLILKAKNIYGDIKGKATDIYIQNKDKTLKQVYDEIRKFLLNNFTAQKELMKALAQKNYAKALAVVAQIKAQLAQIAPELKTEMESIINQTLRNTVIMTKEIVKAYTPYATLVKDLTKQYSEVIKMQTPILVAKVKELMKKYIEVVKAQAPVIIEQVKQLITIDITKLKDTINVTVGKLDANIRELIAKVMKNEDFIKYVATVEIRLNVLKQLIQEKVEELKRNPTFIEVKAKLEAKIADLEKLVKGKIQEIKNNPKLAETKKQVVESLQKQVAELQNAVVDYKRELDRLVSDARIAKVTAVLKQMQVSATFSAGKLQESLRPYMDDAVNTLKSQLAPLPQQANRVIENFANAPEDTFWSGVAVTKEAVNTAIVNAKSVNKQQIVDACDKFYRDALAFTVDIAIKTTDQWTKQTAITLFIKTKVLMTRLEGEYKRLNVRYADLMGKVDQLPAFLRVYYSKNMYIAKALIEENMLVAKSFAEQSYSRAIVFTTLQYEELKQMWNNSAWKTLYDNQIWGEIATEIKNHELLGLAMQVNLKVIGKVMVLTNQLATVVNNNRAIFEKKFGELKATIENQYSELRTVSEKTYAALKVAATQKYADIQKVIKKVDINELIKKTEKLFAEKTIADIVAFVQKQYSAAMEQLEVAKVAFNNLVEQYTAKVNELYAKYEVELKKAFADAKENVLKLAEEYKGKAMKIAMPYYTNIVTLRSKVLASYTKYRPIVDARYEKMADKAVATFNKIKDIVEAQYKQLDEQARQLVAKTMTVYQTYKSQVLRKTNEIRAKINYLNIRAKINYLKTLTVRQTIEALLDLPVLVKRIIVAKVNQISARIIEQYNQISARIIAEYKRYEAIVKDLCKRVRIFNNQMRRKINARFEIIKPYLKSVENEIRETALFVFRYYKIEGQVSTIKAYLAKQIERILEDAKRIVDDVNSIVPMIPVTLKKYADLYKTALTRSATVYGEQYKKLADGYARDATVKATLIGDKAKVAYNKGLKYVQAIDIEQIKAAVSNIVSELKKYVTVSVKDGEILVKIAHTDMMIPTARKYLDIAKVTAKTTYMQLTSRARQVLSEVEIQLLAFKEQAEELRSQIKKQVMESTDEIVRDLRIMFKVNKNISKRIYKVLKSFIEKRYGNALSKFTDAVELSQGYVGAVVATLQSAYIEGIRLYNELARTTSAKEMYQMIYNYLMKYYTVMKQVGYATERKYRPVVEAALRNTIKAITARGLQLKNEVNPYYVTLKKALDDIQAGVPASEALKPITVQVQPILAQYKGTVEAQLKQAIATMQKQQAQLMDVLKPYLQKMTEAYEKLRAGVPITEVIKPLMKQLNFDVKDYKVRAKLCSPDPSLCKLISESVKTHESILSKYLGRVEQLMSTGKAHVDRAYRKVKKVVKSKNSITGDDYTATAMIMGNHILTFDNKFYDFVDQPKSSCSYLLARDFQDKKFTLRKVDGAIIAETPDMSIKIRDDGRVKTTIGNEISFSLPVESGNSACVRVDNLILCHFRDQQLKITVDLKNFFTVISVSGWYQGKSQGLLGTFNRESHDDWRMPNGRISKNPNEFANAYELSGNPKCRLALETDPKKTCNKPASKRCATTFKSSSSPLVSFFDIVDPTPFMEACTLDTQCKKASLRRHCSVVAAYVTVLRTKGVWVEQLAECMSDKGHKVNQEWVQKSQKKNLDVVVMVSQRTTMKKIAKRVIPLMTHLHKMFKNDKFSIRFALIGFGGQGIHEPAHSHPLRRGQTVFGYIDDFRRELKSMAFSGEEESTNDAYHAILMASKLKFRPAAEKAFILFNSEPHSSHESGPSYDEASYILQRVANAPLFVFDDLQFPSFGKAAGKVIGETARKLYTTNKLQGTSATGLVLPASEFKDMALSSNGGLFSNRIRVPKQVAISLHDAVLNWVVADSKFCKRCTLRGSWTGLPRPVCVSDRTAKC